MCKTSLPHHYLHPIRKFKKGEACGCFVCGIVHPCTLHGVPSYPNCVGFHILPTVMLEMSTYHFGAIKIGQLKAT